MKCFFCENEGIHSCEINFKKQMLCDRCANSIIDIFNEDCEDCEECEEKKFEYL